MRPTITDHTIDRLFSPAGTTQSTFNGAIPTPANPGAHLLTPQAAAEMRSGRIPNLGATCTALMATFISANKPSALQFFPAMHRVVLSVAEAARFLEHETTRHVLIQNDRLKVVLIHWAPGESSNVHGHPSGGCVFKVLRGKLVEKRFRSDASHELLGTQVMHAYDMAYIDDSMAYHAVGNPFGESAISLHAYTPGKK